MYYKQQKRVPSKKKKKKTGLNFKKILLKCECFSEMPIAHDYCSGEIIRMVLKKKSIDCLNI